MRHTTLTAAAAAALLAGCASTPSGPLSIALGSDPAAACAALTAPVPASAINAAGLPSGAASIDSATWMAATPLAVAERGPTPAGRISPATPAFCRVLGRIAPVDPAAPPILFQVNLPASWNGRSVQYGGGGFNGTLINALGLPPAQRFDTPTPLAQGFITVGTDSGHQTRPGEPPQAFALNDEALVNFAHASYKKVRDVSVALARRAYGRAPVKLYFVGSSEGGREGLTMAQRYPDAAILAPVIFDSQGVQGASFHAGTEVSARQTPIVPDGELCVNFVSGAVMMLNLSNMKSIGFFDPWYFLYGEDDDLCIRIRKAGGSIIVVNDAFAEHHTRESSTPSFRTTFRRAYCMTLSKFYITRKYQGSFRCFRMMMRIGIGSLLALPIHLILMRSERAIRMSGRIAATLMAWPRMNATHCFEPLN